MQLELFGPVALWSSVEDAGSADLSPPCPEDIRPGQPTAPSRALHGVKSPHEVKPRSQDVTGPENEFQQCELRLQLGVMSCLMFPYELLTVTARADSGDSSRDSCLFFFTVHFCFSEGFIIIMSIIIVVINNK